MDMIDWAVVLYDLLIAVATVLCVALWLRMERL